MRVFDSHIQGIPCQIKVVYWEPFVPGRFSGPPEQCYPDEGGYGEWEVLDRKGRKAPWLEKRLNEQETQRIETEMFNHMEKECEEW